MVEVSHFPTPEGVVSIVEELSTEHLHDMLELCVAKQRITLTLSRAMIELAIRYELMKREKMKRTVEFVEHKIFNDGTGRESWLFKTRYDVTKELQ